MKKHPMQPIEFDDRGVIRFKRNKIVDALVRDPRRYVIEDSRGAGLGGRLDLTRICIDADNNIFDQDDLVQFWQLMGYSVSGYGDLSFVPKSVVTKADKIAAKTRRPRKKK